MNTLALSIHTVKESGQISAQPAVLVGKLPQGFQVRQPMLVDENRTWIIQHNTDYTLYSLYVKDINISLDQKTNISFNLFLPAKKKMDEGYTVLEVLNKIEDIWSQAVSTRPNRTSPLCNTDFEAYISKIPLADRELLFPLMTGDKPASHCICNNGQLGALLNFSRYIQLSVVAWLELGHNCDTTIQLPITQKQFRQIETPTKVPAAPKEPKPSISPKVSAEVSHQSAEESESTIETAPPVQESPVAEPEQHTGLAPEDEPQQSEFTYTDSETNPSLLSTSGRCKRGYYLLVNITLFISTILYIFLRIIAYDVIHVKSWLKIFTWADIFVTYVLFRCFIATSVKRLHDLGHSGAFVFLHLIPFPFLHLYLLIFKGQKHDNKYGPNPYKS